ncbi:ABC transporter permease [Leptolyngbya sp. 15MV]|nr:ABC transporter permease [Leptolyngbya sp. 15MV]
MGHLGGRLLQAAFVLWVVVTLCFLMFRLMPGDPTLNYIDTSMTEEQRQEMLRAFGLDQPLFTQYLIYLRNLLVGELGASFLQGRPVLEIVLETLPNTLVLTLTALFVAYVFGVIAGAFLAWKRGTVAEGVAIPLVLTTRAAPEFWLGMLLLAVFAFAYGIFPSGGAASAGPEYDSELDRFLSWDFLHHLALPAIALAVYLQGLPLLLMRSTMLEVMQDEFVTMARMKGLSEWTIVIRHAARNALLPVATAFALGVGGSVGGNVVIETVFSWPGLGRTLGTAVQGSDYPLAQGAFLIIAAVLVLMNLIADLLYGWLDPRVSHGRKG